MKVYNYAGGLTTYKVRVEVFGESDKSYHVRLLERGAQGQAIGTTYWARKRNVILDGTPKVRKDVPENYKLPYKD